MTPPDRQNVPQTPRAFLIRNSASIAAAAYPCRNWPVRGGDFPTRLSLARQPTNKNGRLAPTREEPRARLLIQRQRAFLVPPTTRSGSESVLSAWGISSNFPFHDLSCRFITCFFGSAPYLFFPAWSFSVGRGGSQLHVTWRTAQASRS